MSETEKKPINLADYTYEKGTKIEISSELFEALMETLTIVEQQETKNVLLNTFPQAKAKDKIEYKDHDAKTFFSQDVQTALTVVGASCLDLKFNLLQVHQENVISGKAINKYEVRDEVKLS